MKPKLKRRLFRLAAAILGPLVFLGAVELVLRGVGYGYPTSFFIGTGQDGVLKENDQFAWLYFPRSVARGPLPRVLREEKPTDTTRIFVLGGSAAKGEPAPEYGFARVLEVLLKDRHPGRTFEVVNVGVTAINSHVILPVAREIARLDGDFWIVYMGNNEAIGPFGAGAAFGSHSAGSRLLPLVTALRATKTGQLLEDIGRSLGGEGETPEVWRGMEMFMEHQVRRDDPRMESVYGCFTENLKGIVEAGAQSGAHVLLSTIVTNLRDCAPFDSLNSAALTDSESAEWKKLYTEGTELQASGDTAAALEAFERALSIDASHAELQFRTAMVYEAQGKYGEAREHYLLARDFDTLRFRADSRINETIRRTAANGRSRGVHLLDAERLAAEMSPHGISGEESFYEHVHFNFEGNYALGRWLAEAVSDLLSSTASDPTRPWLDGNECARRLALTPWDRLRVTQVVRRRLQKPPYSRQLGHSKRDRHLQEDARKLMALIEAAGFAPQSAVYHDALERSPADWVLREQYGSFLAAYGRHAEAQAELSRALELVPHNFSARYRLGVVYFHRGDLAEAESCFRETLRLKPHFVEALDALAMALARQDLHEDACRHFARALEIRPEAAPVHVRLGRSLEALGRSEEAATHYREALRLQPANVEAKERLARLSSEATRQTRSSEGEE